MNIALSKDLLQEIDQTAREEYRTRSDLIREAARRYVGSKKRWKTLFRQASMAARRAGLDEQGVAKAIELVRARKRSPRLKTSP